MPLISAQPLLENQRPQQWPMAEMSAVALAGQSAANVSFQRRHASLPPTQNANSAPRSLNLAVQFSGSIANCAIYAAINAILTVVLKWYVTDILIFYKTERTVRTRHDVSGICKTDHHVLCNHHHF